MCLSFPRRLRGAAVKCVRGHQLTRTGSSAAVLPDSRLTLVRQGACHDVHDEGAQRSPLRYLRAELARGHHSMFTDSANCCRLGFCAYASSTSTQFTLTRESSRLSAAGHQRAQGVRWASRRAGSAPSSGKPLLTIVKSSLRSGAGGADFCCTFCRGSRPLLRPGHRAGDSCKFALPVSVGWRFRMLSASRPPSRACSRPLHVVLVRAPERCL